MTDTFRFVAALAALGACGCGGKDARAPVYPAAGMVTVNGRPAEGAQVVLFPTEEALRATGRRPPTAVAGPEGRFDFGSTRPARGPPAGEYQVTIVWPEDPKTADPNNPETPPARDRLNSRYAAPAGSGLTATIDAAPTELAPFDLR